MGRIKRNKPEERLNKKAKRTGASLRKKTAVTAGYDSAPGPDATVVTPMEMMGLITETLDTVGELRTSGLAGIRPATRDVTRAARPTDRLRELFRDSLSAIAFADFTGFDSFTNLSGRVTRPPPEVSERAERTIASSDPELGRHADIPVTTRPINVHVSMNDIADMEVINSSGRLTSQDFAEAIARATSTTLNIAGQTVQIREPSLGESSASPPRARHRHGRGGFVDSVTAAAELRRDVPAVLSSRMGRVELARVADDTSVRIREYLSRNCHSDVTIEVTGHMGDLWHTEMTCRVTSSNSTSRQVTALLSSVAGMLQQTAFVGRASAVYAAAAMARQEGAANECEVVLAGMGEPYFYLGLYPVFYVILDLDGNQLEVGEYRPGAYDRRAASRARATSLVGDFLGRRGL